MNFHRSITIAGLWRPEVAIRCKQFHFWRFLKKNNPLRGYFPNSVLKEFIATPINVLCSNFVKFGRREISKIVRCLPDKKFTWLSSSCYCADRAQNLPGPAPENVLRVLQISSKSVHFRRSYTWTREHHQNWPYSVSSLRLKPSFEPNNDMHHSFV